ncbi:hypothetical protein SAMN05421542_3765 [Chryseobacterium jejuense]|uniref:Uncharacterized protein n=2 Tax=Chryseobacterium jejuense TaxID=445960 RepID=A0A2X2X6C5_CHRJE|nr:hypothetical protein SAMN05421542_3765 [Chryseobacterium jejuense]SQB46241.1 Uncharacterised protein [Chryseobacterium jejuense]
MPVSNFQDKAISIISAEKTEWSGGRAGVKGTIYTIKLRKKNNIIIKTLMAEGNKIPFSQNISGGAIVIQGSFQYKNNNEANVEDLPAGSSIESTKKTTNFKDSWIEYTLEKSNRSHRISIPKFTSVETYEELAP